MQNNAAPADQIPAKSAEQLIIEHLSRLLTAPSLSAAKEIPQELSQIDGLRDLHDLLLSLRELTKALSAGDLEHMCRGKGFVIGSLKALQANLRHLTWQAGRIAAGEYFHRVTFMGDFAAAFNSMTEQLDSLFKDLTSVSEKYKDLSYHDALTGLYNRLAFFNLAGELLSNTPASTLIIADIDFFKKFNDTYGHLCGDLVLKCFAKTLSSALRPKDLCCRYGGEEFLILMPGTPIDIGLGIANRLRQAIEIMTVAFEGQHLGITSSMGLCAVADIPQDENFTEALDRYIQLADENLYKAKNAGRNIVIGPDAVISASAAAPAPVPA